VKNDDPLSAALGMRPIHEAITDDAASSNETPDLPVVQETLQANLVVSDEDVDHASIKEMIDDIELARKNVQDIITKGGESLEEIIDLAKQSESPRAFEVVSGLMKTLLDANRQFVEIAEKKRYTKEDLLKPKEEETSQSTNVTNNNLILSTSDLLKMLKGEDQ
jgi:uncharacterized protein YdbL (DUF1318 family)